MKLKHRLYYWWLVLTGRWADRVVRRKFIKYYGWNALYLGSAVWFHGNRDMNGIPFHHPFNLYDAYYFRGEYWVIGGIFDYPRQVTTIANGGGFHDWFGRVFKERFQYQVNMMLEVD